MKVNVILNNFNRITSIIKFPLKETLPVVEIEDYTNFAEITKGTYGIENDKIVYLGYTSESIAEQEENRKNALRKQRKYLLKGFDLWEKAMLAGRETNDKYIYDWYYDLLELEDRAFYDENIPSRIKYYLERSK